MDTDGGTVRQERLTEDEFVALFRRLKRTAGWGTDDRRGALNHLTAAQVLTAVQEVRLGRSVSLARPIESAVSADDPDPAHYDVTGAVADHHIEDGLDFAMDRFAMNVHGNANSHIDALSHVIFDSKFYNDVPIDVITATGADFALDRYGSRRHRRPRCAPRHPSTARATLARAGRHRHA